MFFLIHRHIWCASSKFVLSFYTVAQSGLIVFHQSVSSLHVSHFLSQWRLLLSSSLPTTSALALAFPFLTNCIIEKSSELCAWRVDDCLPASFCLSVFHFALRLLSNHQGPAASCGHDQQHAVQDPSGGWDVGSESQANTQNFSLFIWMVNKYQMTI